MDPRKKHRYRVVRDTILPVENGATERVKAGDVVEGPHYERFLKTGYLVPAPPEEAPEEVSTAQVAPDKGAEAPQEAQTEAQSTESAGPDGQDQEDPGEAVGDPGAPGEALVWTRDELEAMTKTELQDVAEEAPSSVRKSKPKLISWLEGKERPA